MPSADELFIDPTAILRSALSGLIAARLPDQLVIVSPAAALPDTTEFVIKYTCPACQQQFRPRVLLFNADLRRAYNNLDPLMETIEGAILKKHP